MQHPFSNTIAEVVDARFTLPRKANACAPGMAGRGQDASGQQVEDEPK